MLILILAITFIFGCSKETEGQLNPDYVSIEQIPIRYQDGSFSVKGFLQNKGQYENKSINILGIVDFKYKCPQCPRGALCKPCVPTHINLADTTSNITSENRIIINFFKDDDIYYNLKLGEEIIVNVTYSSIPNGVYNKYGFFVYNSLTRAKASNSIRLPPYKEKDFPPFTGQVNAKLVVKDSQDLDMVRQRLIKELGQQTKIRYYSGQYDNLKSLPFLTIAQARVEDLQILEKSDLVEFFYSDEPKPTSYDSFGQPKIGQPLFQWSYTKEYGYQIGTSRSPNAKQLKPELIYEIYRSKGKNIPKEIIDEWNKVK